MRWLFT